MKYSLSYDTLNLTCGNITCLFARVAGCGENNEVGSTCCHRILNTSLSLGLTHILL